MALSPSKLKQVVSTKVGQEPEGTTEGPHLIGAYHVTRVWTQDSKGEYHAHYAVEEGKRLEVYENFSPFAIWLGNAFDLDRAAAREDKQVRLGVAVIVILAALGLLIFQTIKNNDSSFLYFIATTIIGGGAGYMFGTWSKSKTPPPTP